MDIVERLRGLVEEWWECCDNIHEPLAEAADEIERLREALQSIKKIPRSEAAYAIIQTFVDDARKEKE